MASNVYSLSYMINKLALIKHGKKIYVRDMKSIMNTKGIEQWRAQVGGGPGRTPVKLFG